MDVLHTALLSCHPRSSLSAFSCAQVQNDSDANFGTRPITTGLRLSPIPSSVSGGGSKRWNKRAARIVVKSMKTEADEVQKVEEEEKKGGSSFLTFLCPLLKLFGSGDPAAPGNVFLEVYPCPKGSLKHREFVKKNGGQEHVDLLRSGASIHTAPGDFCNLRGRPLPRKKVTDLSSQQGESRLRWRCSSAAPTHGGPSAAAGDEQQRLVVVGGGAAGVYGALRAKSLCPHLEVLVLEKGQLLSKVRVSGGGRCNVTTGLFRDPKPLAGQYPRGHKELRGSYFLTHGPADTATWFTQRGVALKTESDGRMFPESNSSATIIDCLLQEAKRVKVILQTKAQVNKVSRKGQRFEIRTGAADSAGKDVVEASSVLLATGSASQGYKIARDLGHSIIEPVPSLFSFKVMDKALTELAGVSFQMVKAELELPNQLQRYHELVQDGPLLITHWGFSGPVVLRLSAWAARHLFSSKYTCTLWVDFTPSLDLDELKVLLVKHKQESQKSNMGSYSPERLQLVKRFWIYLLGRQGLDRDLKWARVSTKALHQLAMLLKRCPFSVSGKGEFKDEFVTAGGVPLAEVNLRTMESRICPGLFFAGEILDVDGVTGGFNFQNAWTGGYIAGTTVAERSTQTGFSVDEGYRAKK